MSFTDDDLENSGLDFEGSRASFWKVQGRIFQTSRTCSVSFFESIPQRIPAVSKNAKNNRQGQKMPKRPQISRMPKMQRTHTMLQTQTNEFHHARPILSQWPGHKKGGRRWSPPGGFQLNKKSRLNFGTFSIPFWIILSRVFHLIYPNCLGRSKMQKYR